MNNKVAIPIEGGRLSAHFGHCEQFYFADIENGKIVKEETITSPEHQPGVYPVWVKQQGANAVIAGGIGWKAKICLLKKISWFMTECQLLQMNHGNWLNYLLIILPILVDTCNNHSNHKCNN